MGKQQKTAINPTREEDYPEWYQQVIKAAQLAENSPVRGCMVILPWGYGIWEKLKASLDHKIKETGHENVYFPQFIPLSYLEKEADHVDGFAKECAIVTHHRLEEKDGKLIPSGELEEPLVIRPTSETVIGHAFAKWIQSYRDLPVKINQWANVVRWEMRPRLFLRTTEFLWQEGHTAHSSAEEAQEEALRMLEVYRTIIEDILAIPTIAGNKTESEKFPGAKDTYCLEAMMQDRKALQAVTSHDMGQNFAKAFSIEYSNDKEELSHAYTTSWGATTRLIGGMIMVHGDDDGLRLPPRIAPKHLVIVPFLMKEKNEEVLEFAHSLAKQLKEISYAGDKIEVFVDDRDMRSGEKNWHWIKKGIPLRLEVGLREIEEGVVTLARRDFGPKEKIKLSIEDLKEKVPEILESMQKNYFSQAKTYFEQHCYTHIENYEDFKSFFTPKNAKKPEAHGGFVLAKWCEDPSCEDKASEQKVTIRCIPFKQRGGEAPCVICGKQAKKDAVFAKSY